MIYTETIGHSVNGLDISACSNFDLHEKPASPFSLIIGGMHGDERAPVPILENFISRYLKTGIITRPTCVIPLLNPDGYRANTRTNARGVDLNRNFPCNWIKESEEYPGPAPLSEPESKALHQFIIQYRPGRIINLHWALSEIDADGEQSVSLAESMWASLTKRQKRKYRLRLRGIGADEKVECPGSLGQWCGYGRIYPGNKRPAMITLELPYTTESSRKLHPLPEDSFKIMLRIWEKDSSKYLSLTEPAVHNLLKAFLLNDEK